MNRGGNRIENPPFFSSVAKTIKGILMAHNDKHFSTRLFKIVHLLCRYEGILEKHCYGHWTYSTRNWCHSRGNFYGFFITNISHQSISSRAIWILSQTLKHAFVKQH